MTTDVEAIDLPFTQAIKFFQRKARVPTQRWNDVWRQEHSHNFMVAGATSDALLKDFQDALKKALEKGTTLATFRADFDAIVEKHGWSYNGSPGWRSRIIYETNLSTAYAAGRYMQLTEPDTLAAFPYWQYVHSGSQHPRLQHLAWDGLTLRADDPFWETHYPPNGWHCGCRVRPVSDGDLGRMGKKGPDATPPLEYRPWTDKVTGVVHQVPIGIDPGFDYNPGLAARTGLANVPVKTDPMRPGDLPSTPKAPEAGAPLPPVPAALQRFLDAPSGSVDVGNLPAVVQKALGSSVAPVRLSDQTLAKQRENHPDLDDKHYGLLPDLVRRPTVALSGDNERVLLLRRSGAVWLAVVKTIEAGTENYVMSFRRTGPKEVQKLLERYDQVYGDADDLGSDAE